MADAGVKEMMPDLRNVHGSERDLNYPLEQE